MVIGPNDEHAVSGERGDAPEQVAGHVQRPPRIGIAPEIGEQVP